MLCPEVSNFESVSSSVKVGTPGVTLEQLRRRVTNSRPHAPITEVRVTMPNLSRLPDDIRARFVHGSSYYSVWDLASGDVLLSEAFIKGFVAGGRLTLISDDGQVCLDPDGILTTQGVGPGTMRTCLMRCLVDATEKRKCLQSLEKLRSLRSPFHFVWRPNVREVSPSSLAKFFHDHGLLVKERSIEEAVFLKTDVACPLFDFPVDEDDVVLHDNWSGAICLDFDKIDMIADRDSVDCQSAAVAVFRGLFEPESVFLLVNDMYDLQTSTAKNQFQWVTVSFYSPRTMTQRKKRWSKSLDREGTASTCFLFGDGSVCVSDTSIA